MNRKIIRWLALLLVVLLTLPFCALAGDGYWRVNVMHDLRGGSWPDGMEISPYQLKAKVGQNMAADSLDAEKLVKPYMAESIFLGWSVLFTDAQTGKVIYDSGNEVWDLNQPFGYYARDPRLMNCLMTARWKSTQSSGDTLARQILPDGRLLTWPFPTGTDPLPEIPPPAHQLIAGTEWFTNALICGIDEGAKVPVYAFPVFNGPVMDWVGLDDRMDYGMYLPDGWVMLYNPRWVENAGIGFMGSDAIAFPGYD